MNKVLFELSCNHLMLLPAKYALDEIVCVQCAEFSLITGVHVWEWHFKCARCTAGRWTGLSKDLARQLGNAHYRKTAHDPIVIGYDKNPEALKTLERLQNAGVVPKPGAASALGMWMHRS